MHAPGASGFLSRPSLDAAFELQDGARYFVAETWFALLVMDNNRLRAGSPAEARTARSSGGGRAVCGMRVVFSATPSPKAGHERWFA